eukprot:GDKK01022389.1.p1 GENE.GDKK01022389.1~~GDKK01022389.1.p1  ORF type:complete len:803 (-),score=194.51 GDKK01022389.1:235-2643(-)
MDYSSLSPQGKALFDKIMARRAKRRESSELSDGYHQRSDDKPNIDNYDIRNPTRPLSGLNNLNPKNKRYDDEKNALIDIQKQREDIERRKKLLQRQEEELRRITEETRKSPNTLKKSPYRNDSTRPPTFSSPLPNSSMPTSSPPDRSPIPQKYNLNNRFSPYPAEEVRPRLEVCQESFFHDNDVDSSSTMDVQPIAAEPPFHELPHLNKTSKERYSKNTFQNSRGHLKENFEVRDDKFEEDNNLIRGVRQPHDDSVWKKNDTGIFLSSNNQTKHFQLSLNPKHTEARRNEKNRSSFQQPQSNQLTQKQQQQYYNEPKHNQQLYPPPTFQSYQNHLQQQQQQQQRLFFDSRYDRLQLFDPRDVYPATPATWMDRNIPVTPHKETGHHATPKRQEHTEEREVAREQKLVKTLAVSPLERKFVKGLERKHEKRDENSLPSTKSSSFSSNHSDDSDRKSLSEEEDFEERGQKRRNQNNYPKETQRFDTTFKHTLEKHDSKKILAHPLRQSGLESRYIEDKRATIGKENKRKNLQARTPPPRRSEREPSVSSSCSNSSVSSERSFHSSQSSDWERNQKQLQQKKLSADGKKRKISQDQEKQKRIYDEEIDEIEKGAAGRARKQETQHESKRIGWDTKRPRTASSSRKRQVSDEEEHPSSRKERISRPLSSSKSKSSERRSKASLNTTSSDRSSHNKRSIDRDFLSRDSSSSSSMSKKLRLRNERRDFEYEGDHNLSRHGSFWQFLFSTSCCKSVVWRLHKGGCAQGVVDARGVAKVLCAVTFVALLVVGIALGVILGMSNSSGSSSS